MKLYEFKENNQILNNTLEAIKIENEKLENKKAELEELKKEILDEKQKKYEEISKYSTFDTDMIGQIIAELLTRKEENNYKYVICSLKESKYKGYDFIKRNNQYEETQIPIGMIVKDIYTPFLNDPIKKTDFLIYLSCDNSSIVLDIKNKLEKKINLYNLDLELNINVPSTDIKFPKVEENNYKTIKDYIDSVVDYRLQNDKVDITYEEMYDLLIKTPIVKKYDNVVQEKNKIKVKR